MNKKLAVVMGVFVLSVSLFLFFPLKVSATECKLTAAYWGARKTISVGDEAVLFVEGENCNGYEVSFNIYEYDSIGSNNFIGTEKAKFFDNKKYTISTEHTFTREDYTKGGDEAGEEDMFFKAQAGNSKINSESPNLVVKKPSAAGNCVLRGADWSKSSVKLEEEVFLRVKGSGCKDFEVAFNIYEFDITGGGGTYIKGVTGKFGSDTEAAAPYKFTKADYAAGGDEIGNEKMFFRASAGSSNINSITAGGGSDRFLEVSGDVVQSPSTKVWACVDDNNTYICSPGNKEDLSDTPVCQGKIPTQINQGLCDKKVGTGEEDSDDGSGSPPANTTVSFNIENPIKAKSFQDLANIIGVWFFNLSIPIAVIVIIYAGFMMLTDGGKGARFKQGGQILWYASLGLAIIFIGKGFVTLIKSILDLANR